MLDAAIVGLGRWGQNYVNSVQGASTRVRFTRAVVRTPDKSREFADKHALVEVSHRFRARENERPRMLGNRRGVGTGRCFHRNAARGRRLDIDRVDAAAVFGDHFETSAGVDDAAGDFSVAHDNGDGIMTTRRSTSWPADRMARLQALHGTHSRRPRPAEVGRVIGIRRK